MPSWRLHWLVADLLGYGHDEEVEKLVDSGPIHDLGIAIVKEPLAPCSTEGGERRHRLAEEVRQVLLKLVSKVRLFYLHHALDDLFERVKSSKLLGIRLDPNVVLDGIRIDLQDIHLRIVDMLRRVGASFPPPSEDLLEDLRKRFDEIVEVLSSEAMEKLRARIEWEERVGWSEFVRRTIENLAPLARRYFEGVSKMFHRVKAIDMARTYLLNMSMHSIVVEASKRSRFYDYIAVYGSSLRKFFTNVSRLKCVPLDQIVLELRVQHRPELIGKLESSWKRMKQLIKQAEKILPNVLENVLSNLIRVLRHWQTLYNAKMLRIVLFERVRALPKDRVVIKMRIHSL